MIPTGYIRWRIGLVGTSVRISLSDGPVTALISVIQTVNRVKMLQTLSLRDETSRQASKAYEAVSTFDCAPFVCDHECVDTAVGRRARGIISMRGLDLPCTASPTRLSSSAQDPPPQLRTIVEPDSATRWTPSHATAPDDDAAMDGHGGGSRPSHRYSPPCLLRSTQREDQESQSNGTMIITPWP